MAKRQDELNATQGSLLGFLHDGPKTGWDLLQTVQTTLARFWSVTPSHVYRELANLERRKLVRAEPRGARDKKPYAITKAGERAFAAWIAQEPGAEQIRFPLLVTLWFGRHLDRATLAGFVERQRVDHEQRLALYTDAAATVVGADAGALAVLDFGVRYEQAVLEWLAGLPAGDTRPPARDSSGRRR